MTAAHPVECMVGAVGLDGDGIATLPDGTLYLPATLPGERVRATPDAPRGPSRPAGSFELIEPSPDRVEPPCPHFPTCGGCTLQHWAAAPAAAWKSARVADALRRAGFDPQPGPVAVTPPLARRRMDLAIRRTPGGDVLVGLHRHRSPEVVDLHACLVLHPALFALAAPLRTLMPRLRGFRREASAIANLLDTGPDLLLRTDASLDTADHTLLASFARTHGIPRIAWALGNGLSETACALAPATLTLGGATLSPAPGAFLQASREGEAAIVAAVLAGLPPRMKPRARIVELFAGYGTLSLPLATRAHVTAYEADAPACAALRQASAGRIDVQRRDLQRQPPQPRELAGNACAVLDPPWAGAGAPLASLAAARIPRIIYVGCNPVALGRDAAVLHAAGYRLLATSVIDQFLWSARVEAVVVFGLEK